MASKKDLSLIKISIAHSGLPKKSIDIHLVEVLKIISFDKKNSFEKINFSLPKKVGEIAINIHAKEDLIIKAIETIL